MITRLQFMYGAVNSSLHHVRRVAANE